MFLSDFERNILLGLGLCELKRIDQEIGMYEDTIFNSVSQVSGCLSGFGPKRTTSQAKDIYA
jgi:hypothetical protein